MLQTLSYRYDGIPELLQFGCVQCKLRLTLLWFLAILTHYVVLLYWLNGMVESPMVGGFNGLETEPLMLTHGAAFLWILTQAHNKIPFAVDKALNWR